MDPDAGRAADVVVAPTTGETVELFLVVMGRVLQHITERSAEFDLSPAQAKALHHLSEPRSMGELAGFMFCDASNITGIVDRLEARGLVERQVVPGDRRVKRLVLTEAGRDLWQAHHERVYAEMPLVASLSPEEHRALHGLLARIIGPTE